MDQGSLKLIGNTPLVRLQNIKIPNEVEIWLKYEAGNPTGSYKDRMALSVLTTAINNGVIKKGDRIIEYRRKYWILFSFCFCFFRTEFYSYFF